MEAEKVKCLIIGSGPAGYTAAIYAARANLSPVLYEGLQPGGQLTTTTDIENFPGYPEGISGTQMMDDLRRQAERFGTDLRYGVATAADLSRSPYKITIDEEKVIEAQTIIIATGAAAKYLGLEDEKKYAGMGVSACATCDGFFYRNAIFIYQTIDNFCCMSNNFRITKIKLISASVINLFSMSHKVPVIRNLICFRAFDSHNFKFQPYSRDHSFRTDIIHHFF